MYIYRHRPASWNLIGEKINWETAWNRRAALHTSAPCPADAAGDGCLSLVPGVSVPGLRCPALVLNPQPWCWVPIPAPQGAQLWLWVPRSPGARILGCPGSQHQVLCSSRRLQLALGCRRFGGVASSGCSCNTFRIPVHRAGRGRTLGTRGPSPPSRAWVAPRSPELMMGAPSSLCQ